MDLYFTDLTETKYGLVRGFRRTNAVISLKRGKIGPRLLLKSNRKSYIGAEINDLG